jgi:hypothetical protein
VSPEELDAMEDLILAARKLRHSEECGMERRTMLEMIDRAIRRAAKLCQEHDRAARGQS